MFLPLAMRAPIIQKLLQRTSDAPPWRTRNALLYIFVLLLCLLAATLPKPIESPLAALQRSLFDTQMRWLREYYPRPAAVEPVLIGIDESTIALFPEPQALWHGHLAQLLAALARAGPAALGMDIVLPERSYENILPGVQIALIRSLFAARQSTKPVFARAVGRDSKAAPMHPSYERMLGDENIGFDQVLTDPDTVSRRFDEREMGGGTPIPSLTGQIARALGKPVGAGYIDYSRGEQLEGYIRMQQVIGWLQDENDAELRRRFEGKVVLIGFAVKDLDRRNLPVALASTETLRQQNSFDQPGVFIHLQILRSLLGAGLIKPLPDWAAALVALLLAAVVWLPSSLRRFLGASLLLPLLLTALSLFALQANLMLPLALWVATFLLALSVRAIADGLETAVEKNRLKQSFAGSVSPDVLHEILAGNIAAGTSAQTMEVCVLFSDIRGFTALSESLPAETVTGVLKRYFDRMVAVAHRYHGTIDKFMGDGMMVLFGAPKPLENACGNAILCARDMVFALKDLNAEFEKEGLPVFAFGIGINYGKVVAGNIGSSERHNYSAIGDVVNVASRLESLTRNLAGQVALTDSVKSKLAEFENNFELIDCGEQPIHGHSPVRVWCIKVETGSTARTGGT